MKEKKGPTHIQKDLQPSCQRTTQVETARVSSTMSKRRDPQGLRVNARTLRIRVTEEIRWVRHGKRQNPGEERHSRHGWEIHSVAWVGRRHGGWTFYFPTYESRGADRHCRVGFLGVVRFASTGDLSQVHVVFVVVVGCYRVCL